MPPIDPDEDMVQKALLGLKAVNEAQTLCQKARNCGFDVREHEALAQAYRQRLEAIVHQFGAGRKD